MHFLCEAVSRNKRAASNDELQEERKKVHQLHQKYWSMASLLVSKATAHIIIAYEQLATFWFGP